MGLGIQAEAAALHAVADHQSRATKLGAGPPLGQKEELFGNAARTNERHRDLQHLALEVRDRSLLRRLSPEDRLRGTDAGVTRRGWKYALALQDERQHRVW